MKGLLVDKVPNISTMLYLGTKFDGFYATNQEAWIKVMNQIPSEATGNPASRSFSSFFRMTVDIVTVFNLGDGEIDISNVQTFRFNQAEKLYTGIVRDETSLALLKTFIRQNWRYAITE